MISLNFYIMLLIVVLIFSSMASSCLVYKPASELLYNGMYPYSSEGFSNKDLPVGVPTKINGFDGLMSSPGAIQNLNEIYVGTKSNSTCKSYGYTNSTGNLCLNANQIKLLSTRGGNCEKI